MDFDLSTSSLFANLVASCIGFSYFTYGKKQRRAPQLIAGVAMMASPLLSSSPAVIAGSCCAVIGAVYLAGRQGL